MKFPRSLALSILCFFCTIRFSAAQQPPLLPDSVVSLFNSELSGESAKRNLEYVTRLHRMRGSAEFRKAIDFIESKLKEYGLQEIEVIQIPVDGKTIYGTQKARPAWEATFAELWELENQGGVWKPKVKLADWEAMPITLAEDSESGEVTAELIDVGAGTSDADYAGKNVRGKLILTSSSPAAVNTLATEKYGAAGIISYAQNQRTAWWKEDDNLIRWGHFDSFTTSNTFCFMTSLKQARDFQQRLAKKETIMLHATVKAGRHAGYYSFVTAVIKGTDASLQQEEIAFTCHLDHQRPGANDNASGSITILEIARAMNKLINEHKLAPPKRTIRFIWSPEIEGTSALLNLRPAYANKIKAVVHMDMVGGGPITKSVFHVSRVPESLPSFVSDVGEAFGRYVNEQSDAYASGYDYRYDFVSREGGKEPLQAVLGNFHLGSDHEVYGEGSYHIPYVYLHDWPDRYIHTNFDVPANIDPTKLKRAAFIGAASGYFLSQLTPDKTPALWNVIQEQALRRTALAASRTSSLNPIEKDKLLANHLAYEKNIYASIQPFASWTPAINAEAGNFYEHLGELFAKPRQPEAKPKQPALVYKRNPAVKGPMAVFSYDYVEDHYGAEKTATIRLYQYQGLWGSGHEYAYEVLNFVDGKRSTQSIRDAVSAEFGPIPVDLVEEYLKALETIQVILK